MSPIESGDDRDDGIEFLTPTGPGSPHHSSHHEIRRAGGSTRWRTIVTAVVGLGAAASLLAMLTTDADEGDATPDTAIIEDEPGDPGVDRESPTDPENVESGPLVVPTPASPSTTRPSADPLLGEPTGWWLFYGGPDPLQRLDLDSGALEVTGLRAAPLMARDGELVIRQASSGAVGWVSAADPSEQADGWRQAVVAPGRSTNDLWTVSGSTWTRHDLTTNRTIEERRIRGSEPAGPAITGRLAALTGEPTLVSTAFGLYRYDGDDYRYLSRGRLLASDSNRALIEECGEQLTDCALRWIEPSTGSELELPLPTVSLLAAEVVGNGRWLRIVSGGDTELFLSLETNGLFAARDVVAAGSIRHPRGALSPDGRWLAFLDDDDQLQLVDVAGGNGTVVFDGLDVVDGGELLFVARTDR